MSSQPNHPVRVVDLDMPFGSMVRFMVKWALASIPALIILFVFGLILSVCAAMFFGGAVAGLAGLANAGNKSGVTTSPSPGPSPTTSR